MRDAFAESTSVPDPPAGCHFENDEQRAAWAEIMHCRNAKGWTYPERHVAWSCMKQMFLIRECERRLEERVLNGCDPCQPDTRSEAYQKNLAAMRKELVTNMRVLGIARAPMKNAIAGVHGELEREANAARDGAGGIGLIAVS